MTLTGRVGSNPTPGVLLASQCELLRPSSVFNHNNPDCACFNKTCWTYRTTGKEKKDKKEEDGRDEGRRNFLKKAAVGSAALVMLPTILGTLSSPVAAEGEDGTGRRHFQFVAFSNAGGVDRVGANGEGKFKVHSPTDITGAGEGSWVHFHPSSPVPPVAFGKWTARHFVSYDPTTIGSPFVGIFGRIQASRVVLKVDLLREFPTKATIPAVLKIICNIGALGSAGMTGEPEGYVLTIPGSPFDTGATPGPFKPFGLGLTHTSIPDTPED